MNSSSVLRKPFRYVYWNAAFVLIGINLLVFLLTAGSGKLAAYLSLNPHLFLKNGFFWQVFTYQFVHGSMSHLLSNMLGLLFFGLTLEKKMGSKEFLLLYLLSGTLCGIFSLFFYVIAGMWQIFLLGASGAVFAILLMYAVLFPRSIIYIWAILPVPAPLLIMAYAAFETFYLVSGSRTGVAHSTHLIGFAVAWVYALVRFGINPARVWFSK